MTTSNETNKPVSTLRDGAIKAVIWRNTGKNGDFFSVQFVRSYKDDQGNYHDTDSINGVDLLRVARLAEKAYDAIVDQRSSQDSDEKSGS